jgi:hypothetical protein
MHLQGSFINSQLLSRLRRAVAGFLDGERLRNFDGGVGETLQGDTLHQRAADIAFEVLITPAFG